MSSRSVLALAYAAGSISWAMPAAAQDAAACYFRLSSNDGIIAACSRMVDSGAYHGRGLVLALGNRGLAFWAKGDLDHAVADFERAGQLDPTYRDAFASLGQV